MKKTLVIVPSFTWIGNDLFCGGLFLCRKTFVPAIEDIPEHFRLDHAVFRDKLDEVGYSHWLHSQQFCLLPDGAIDTKIESLYTAVLDNLKLRITCK